MHIGVKPEGIWWNEKYYPNVPYVFNLLMDPMEKMDPESHEWGYIGRQILRSEDVGADCGFSLPRGASEEPAGLSAAPGSRLAQHEEGD